MPKAREVPTQDDLTEQEDAAVTETMAAAPKRTKKRKKWNRASATGKRQVDTRKRDPSAHTSRAQQTRAAADVHPSHDEPWVRPATLPHIPARAGFVQRWIRVSVRGEADATNISSKMREGWQPRKVDTLPKNMIMPTISQGTYAGCIGVGGNILCEMPKARNDQRNAHYRKRNEAKTAAINNELAQVSSHGHPGFGPIKRAQTSKLVREVAVAPEEMDE
jgi:hypothetical protein